MSLLHDAGQRRTTILGLGREGISTLRFLRAEYPDRRFTVADRRPFDQLDDGTRSLIGALEPLDLVLGDDYGRALESAELVFKTPGISPFTGELAAPLQRFRLAGGRIASNTEMFFEIAPGRIVGVTGTKGKSTTTAAIHRVLANAGIDARLTGNIGYAPLDSLAAADDQTVFVVELSSHQLSGLGHSPHVGVVLPIVREHLDYYGDFDTYVDAKSAICSHQSARDYVLFNAGHDLPAKLAGQSPGTKVPFGLNDSPEFRCTVVADRLVYRDDSGEHRVMPVDRVPLRGEFNLQNVMPAVLIGKLIFELSTEAVADGIEKFTALEHRLELAGMFGGVSFYNDSLATVPEATLAAIAALGDRPLVLIAGGHDRGQDFGELAKEICGGRVKALVLFPTTGRRLWDEIAARGSSMPHAFVETMATAVDTAAAMASAGDIVLMSPAAASFGAFRDYSDRGDQFKASVAAASLSQRQR